MQYVGSDIKLCTRNVCFCEITWNYYISRISYNDLLLFSIRAFCEFCRFFKKNYSYHTRIHSPMVKTLSQTRKRTMSEWMTMVMVNAWSGFELVDCRSSKGPGAAQKVLERCRKLFESCLGAAQRIVCWSIDQRDWELLGSCSGAARKLLGSCSEAARGC